MISKITFAISILSGVVVFWLLNFTTPSSLGPLGILFLFGMAYAFFVGIIALFLYGCDRILHLYFKKTKTRNLGFYYKYSTVLAFSPLIFVTQQSLGGGGIFGFILVVFLMIIICVFISKK